jgi:thioredoxin 1
MVLNIFKYLYISPDQTTSPIIMVTEVTDESFQSFVADNKHAVIDCWAAWCGPCRMLSPIIEELSQERGEVAFGKLDVDHNRATPMKYGIMSIPTLLYFKDGQLEDKTIGAYPKSAIEERLDKLTG